MKVCFSNRGNLRNFRGFLEELDFDEPDNLQIMVNERWMAVHPVNLAIAAALALKVGKWNTEIVGKIPESAYNLEKMGLFRFTRTKSPFRGVNSDDERLIPLTIIRDDQEKRTLLNEQLGRLKLSAEETSVVRVVLGELISNALSYANSEEGVVIAVQYYKKSNRVSLAVCDLGEGLWGSLDRNWHPRNDLEAVHLALTPGVTIDSTMQRSSDINAGAGLFMIKCLARMTRDYFAIYSGTGEYTLLKGDRRLKRRFKGNPVADAHSESNDLLPFQGTLVGLDISLDMLNNREELVDNEMMMPNFQKEVDAMSPEAQEFLNRVCEAYADAIYEQRQENMREPRIS